MFFSRGCDVCDGRGRVWRCPNAAEHARERLRKLNQSLLAATRGRRAGSGLLQDEQAPEGARQCWNCKGRGTIAGKKRIPNPKKYMRGIPGYETIPVDGLVTSLQSSNLRSSNLHSYPLLNRNSTSPSRIRAS